MELISAVVGTKSHGFLGSATSIFSSLCELLGAILNVHRVRIEGRLSVITKQLSKLLECLFEPFANTQLTRPPWILNSETKLSVEAAKKYSRVLTTLCDPTVSAVRKGRKRNELNDQTKIAKLIAGNNLLILLRDYCSLKLRGKLCAEIEDAIRPGIYAIFDAMIDDVRRELSDSLTSAEKDIFNDLYGDYRKFGKWEGN